MKAARLRFSKEQAIRFRVPLLQAAKPGTEVVAHLLSPNGEALSEARQPVADGASVAEILLDFPKDKKGAPANSIEWYRVVYRVEVAGRPAGNSILSLGAVAQNLFSAFGSSAGEASGARKATGYSRLRRKSGYSPPFPGRRDSWFARNRRSWARAAKGRSFGDDRPSRRSDSHFYNS
jgi:hypothetical protein